MSYVFHEPSTMAKRYMSVTFFVKNAYGTTDVINTYDDWGLVPLEPPVFAPPKKKRTTADVPGSNSFLDLSETVSGFPVYENRTGTFQFQKLRADFAGSHKLRQAIENKLHGRVCKAVVSMDPTWYFEGTFEIDSHAPGKGVGMGLVISYDVHPYKFYYKDSMDEPLWDALDMDEYMPLEGVCEMSLTLDDGAPIDVPVGTMSFLGSAMPCIPVVTIMPSEGHDNDPWVVSLASETHGHLVDQLNLYKGDNELPELMIYDDKEYLMNFRGFGTVRVLFRPASLG